MEVFVGMESELPIIMAAIDSRNANIGCDLRTGHGGKLLEEREIRADFNSSTEAHRCSGSNAVQRVMISPRDSAGRSYLG